MEYTVSTLDGGETQKRTHLTLTSSAHGAFSEMDSEVVPASLAEIAHILRVANEIEEEKPRVAYLCKLPPFKLLISIDSVKCYTRTTNFESF
jgi:callose synthase